MLKHWQGGCQKHVKQRQPQKSLLRGYFHQFYYIIVFFFNDTDIWGYFQYIRGNSLECPGLLMSLLLIIINLAFCCQ